MAAGPDPELVTLRNLIEQAPEQSGTARGLARHVAPVAPDSACEDARHQFAMDASLFAIPVVDGDGVPVGLLNRFKFLERLATRFGHALSANRSVAHYIEPAPLIVDEAMPVDHLAASMMSRDNHYLFDGFIVTAAGQYLGVGTGVDVMRSLDARLLERTRSLELEVAQRQRTEEQLVIAKAAAEEANTAKSTFLANMSHELRTPLNAIIGYSEMLIEEAQTLHVEGFTADLGRIVGAGRHLLALITGVLDLSKIEAGRMDLDVEDFDVAALVQNAVETSHALASARLNTISVAGLDGLGAARGDRTKLQQVLLNLLSNACKFTHEGQVLVHARRETTPAADWLVVDVTDTGIGMTAEQMGRLFREFTQADATTTRRYGGTGLGLAISRRLCHLMGGTLTVESEPGRGSTFTLRVPAELADKPREVSRTSPADRPVTPTWPDGAPVSATGPLLAADGTRVPTVLVIDDDPSAIDLMTRTLDRAGFHTVGAGSAEEGLRLARELAPEAMISDVLLPGMTGWHLLETLKAEPPLQDIPVVVLSVIENRRQSLALGAVEHLIKPVVTDLLIRLLRSATGIAAHHARSPNRVPAGASPGPASRP